MAKRPKTAVVMDGIIQKLPETLKSAEILVLADLHIGDMQSDVRLIKELIDSVAETPSRYAILAGDIMNNAIIGSKGDTYTATLSPTEQLQYAVELLKPIAEKILAVVPGNHEERTTRTAGFDLTAAICTELGIPSVYRENAALLFVSLGRALNWKPYTYSIYINHGRGGGRKIGGKMNALADYGNIIDTDIYIVGHTHLPASFRDRAFRVAPHRGTAILRDRLFVNTASALRYGGYAERQGYQPASNSYPIITLSGEEHRMNATV